MTDEPSKASSDAEKDLEREIRADRKFSLAEAIGRMAGPGMMKGASPVPPKKQAESQIERYISKHLSDSAGALSSVLFRFVRDSDLLLDNFNHPLLTLERYIRRLLDSDYLLSELVRETDAEWGRVFGERPFFEKQDHPPHPADPYTLESVRSSLQSLSETKFSDDEPNG